MTQQVVTELVIDSDTSGADRFSQSMDKAGGSAERGASSVQSMSLAIAGVSVASIAALAALRGFVDYVGGQSQALVDMAANAQLAGFSLREFQETLFAARAKGLTEKDFVSGLDKIGADFTAASRGVTDFGKLFEANGLSIRKANGELKTAKDGVADLAGLMQNATPQIQQAIARIAGISAAWVPFLKQGVDGIEALKKSAAGLGVIIDDDVVNKARDFNDQWKIAVASWDLQFKASLAGILPMLVKLANLASTVLDAAGRAGNFFSRALTPQEDWSTGDLTKQLSGLEQYRDKLAAVNEQMGFFQRQQLIGRSGAIGVTADADLKTIDAQIAKTKELIDQKKALKRVEVTGDGSTVLPPSGTEKSDAVDRALQGLFKHTEAQKADAAAMGLGARAHAELRAEAAMTSAIQANGGKITQEQANAFIWLKLAAGGAADELEKAKIASQIDFGRQTAFLSPQDVAIAQQLKGIYGNDVPAALASSEAAAIRTNSTMKTLGDAAVNFGESLLQAVISGKSGIEALIPALSSLGSSLTKVGTDSLKSGLSTMLKGGGLSGFDPVSLGIGAAGTAISLLTNMLAQREADAKAAADAIQRAADQAQGHMDRIRKASIDTSTLLGELQSFDVDAERERAEAAKNGTRNLALLEQALAAERTAIAERGLKDAQKQFDALVQGAKSATTESIKSLTDATTSLATALTVLGKGIAGLSDDVAVAVAKLQSDFAAGLMDKINEAYGTGYLTQIAALIRQRASDMSDATKLGISPALVDLAFKSQVQKTIDDAQLTGVAFQQVLAAFPQLAGQVHEFSAAAADTTDTLQQTITTLTDFMRKISDFRKSLLVNNTLSTLSPADQLTEAQRQFRDTLALANSGDVTAQGNLQSAASTYLDQAKSFFASSTEYATIFREVQDSLLSSESAAQQQINYAVAQVSWLEQQTHIQQQQLNWLIELNNAVASLSATIAAPAGTTPAASDVNAAAVAAAEAAKTWRYPTVDPYLYGDKGDWTESHRALYRADHPEARYQLGGVIPGMAGGGMVGNGTYGVDSVRARYAGGGDIALAGGEYVMPANQTRQYRSQLDAMRSGTANDNMGSDNGAHFRMLAQTNASGFNAVVSALREEIGELRAEIRRGNSDARIAAKRPATPGKAA